MAGGWTHMYGTRRSGDKSGAYLFLPEGQPEIISIANPRISVIQGSLFSRVIVRLPSCVHMVTLYNSNGPEGYGIEIQNVVNIASINDNFELAMRLTSNIENVNVFYTDLNGIQIIRRKRLKKLPLQGNYYPMPTLAYIEDSNARLTLLSAQPLGVASLAEGQLEVMQDRRLLQDDNRGLSQGVMDNRKTMTIFRLHLEAFIHPCRERSTEGSASTWGKLSPVATSSLESLNYPLEKLISTNDKAFSTIWSLGGGGGLPPPGLKPSSSYLHLVTAVTLPAKDMFTGLILQTSPIQQCLSPHNATLSNSVSLNALIPVRKSERVFKSSLNFINTKSEVKSLKLTLCDIDIAAYIVENF